MKILKCQYQLKVNSKADKRLNKKRFGFLDIDYEDSVLGYKFNKYKLQNRLKFINFDT